VATQTDLENALADTRDNVMTFLEDQPVTAVVVAFLFGWLFAKIAL
jgi:hypothetical protein